MQKTPQRLWAGAGFLECLRSLCLVSGARAGPAPVAPEGQTNSQYEHYQSRLTGGVRTGECGCVNCCGIHDAKPGSKSAKHVSITVEDLSTKWKLGPRGTREFVKLRVLPWGLDPWLLRSF